MWATILLLLCCGPGPAEKPAVTPAVTAPTVVLSTLSASVCAEPDERETEGPWTRSALSHPAVQPSELLGGGLAAGDFDGDSRLDLYFSAAAEGADRLWLQAEDGRFADHAATWLDGIDRTNGTAASVADFDGDGDLDLLISRWGAADALLRNDGDRFVDATPSAMGAQETRSTSSAWADIDGDGDLDLAIGGYGSPPDTFIDVDMPPADRLQLYENLGGNDFADISDRIPGEVHDGYQFQLGFFDLDLDGLPELFSIHDFGRVRQSRLLHNDGGTFSIDGESAFHAGFEGMGLGVGDLNGDLVPDFFQTSFQALSLLESHPSADGASGWMWVETSASRGLTVDLTDEAQCVGWGTELADLDNDRDLDLVAAFGQWTSYDTAATQLDGAWEQVDGAFQSAASAWELDDGGVGRGLLAVDLNRDGWMDTVRRTLDGDSPIHLARCGDASWLALELTDETSANRFGVGARLTVDGDQVRWVQAGSTSLFSGGPPEVHFGLGQTEEPVDIEVLWPDGRVDLLPEVRPRQRVRLTRADPNRH